jgi:hypothetical protein
MAISRRKFVKAATLLTLSVGAPVKAVEVLSHNPRSRSQEIPDGESTTYLDMQSFSRCIGSSFTLRDTPSKTTALKLVEIHDWRSNSAFDTGRECFSLIFLASDTTRLPQNTYATEHSSLGRFSLFVVPIRSFKSGRYYEAVFNRLH